MRELHTEVVISASPSIVWSVLTDFGTYPLWNPFIKKLEGEFRPGSSIDVQIHPPNSKPMRFKPVCRVANIAQELRWKGHLLIPGLFDGEHIFELKELPQGKTHFVQREQFSGILVPILWNSIRANTRAGFEAMNEALKNRAENLTGEASGNL
ncbi:MAG: SRPBCC domain-containing protein [Flavobacteriales bacterium]|nr:SRPBCC domain-containing protein [Flavobacteriales bacterium]